jgi:hypothetical protein
MITNNENLHAVYNSDGTLNSFLEENLNKFSKAGQSQTIGGGEKNVVSGSYSTIVGGYNNQIVNSVSSTILAGQNGVIKNQNGASLIADGENRTHYADESNALTIDFTNGIYLKNKFSAPSTSTNNGIYNKIDTHPNLVIGSYLAGPRYDNISTARNYYPYTGTSIKIQTNNWVKTPGYPLERIDSISSIELGMSGIKLIGASANQQAAGNPAVAYININSDITLESAKDGNSITLIADDTMDLNSATTNLNSYSDINLNADHGPVKIKANYDGDGGNSTAEFTSNGINLISNGGPSGINIHSFGTADFITLKNGIDINSADNNLSLRGERVNITAEDSSVNLYAENGMSLKTDSESINIHAGGGGDSYSDLDLRANRYVTLSGNNIKVNPNSIYGIADSVHFTANDASITLQAENGVNISSELEPINIFTSSASPDRNNISIRAAGDVSLSGNNGVYVHGALYLNGRQLLVSAVGTVFSPTITAG